MDMKKTALVAFALITALFVAGCNGGDAQQKNSGADKGSKAPITVATLNQIDAWPAWAAMKDGSAKEAGADYTMKIYEAGIALVEDMATNKWQIGDAGAVPSMLGVLNRNVTIIGVASDESAANAVLAKEDSPIFKNKVKDGVYGNAESVRGKAIYTTTASSAHYVVQNYLKALGLTESDVNLQNASQPECLKALKDGKADLVVLWSPYLYDAERDGAKVVASGADVGATNYMLYLADRDWAKEHPKEVAAFLKAVSKKTEEYTANEDGNNKALKSFFKDYASLDVSDDIIKKERDTHKLFTAKEQLALMEDGDVAKSMEEVSRFFMDINKLAPSNYGRMVKNNFNIDSTYLKLAAGETKTSGNQ